jgi:outer membrane protein OmpA-like peptidoglycan-associated protein
VVSYSIKWFNINAALKSFIETPSDLFSDFEINNILAKLVKKWLTAKIITQTVMQINQRFINIGTLTSVLVMLLLCLDSCKNQKKVVPIDNQTNAVISTIDSVLLSKKLSPAQKKVSGIMDAQIEALRLHLKNIEITKIDEKSIQVRFDPEVYFAWDSEQLSEIAREHITHLAKVVNEYPLTNIVIEGHTDSTGTEKYNQKLSLKRSAQVVNYLVLANVNNHRLTAKWFGEKHPIAPNSTVEGRRRNRRIDAIITANKEMLKRAEKGEYGELEQGSTKIEGN